VKIDPKPHVPPAFDPNDERYWDARDLEHELRRVFEICHNCRMCVSYCGSFPDMFSRVDRDIEKRGAEGSERLDAHDFKAITELCWQCKLCYIKCPYTADEKHEWLVDVPRLLTREKANRARRDGVTLQDRVLGEPQLLGRANAGAMSAVGNLINANSLVRKVMEKTVGISSKFPLPPFGKQTFDGWLKKHEPLEGAGSAGEIAIFATCLNDYNFPSVAVNAVRVLEKNGFRVVRPEGQTCCGIPNLDGGDIDAARAKAKQNVAVLVKELDAGRTIVVPQPTCSYTIKKEYPELLGTPEAKRVAAATLDLMQLLDNLRKEKKLNKEFKSGLGKIAYHAACHLRAQKIGFPGMRVLNVLPDTEVEMIEQCSAVDGTWGMKAQYYELGRRYAQKLTRGIESAEAAVVITDCSLSAQRILQENGKKALHPAEALARAYGVEVELE
jgi:glycerol-3-phosphate dehydrogenase subunit C